MPIHRFKCRDCEVITEELIRTVHDLNNFICPECGGVTDRLMSAPRVNFAEWKAEQDHLCTEMCKNKSNWPTV